MSQRTTKPLPPHPDVVIEAEQRVWSGRFPLDVVKFHHRRFDGAMSGTRTWELWRRGQAAALLPIRPTSTLVMMLIEQFRFPALAAGVDPVLVELPAGLCEDNEDPAAEHPAGVREEMAMDADRVEHISSFVVHPRRGGQVLQSVCRPRRRTARRWRGDCRTRRRGVPKSKA